MKDAVRRAKSQAYAIMIESIGDCRGAALDGIRDLTNLYGDAVPSSKLRDILTMTENSIRQSTASYEETVREIEERFK